MVCQYWCFNHGFKFQDFVSNGCHDLTMLCLINVKSCYIFYGISKSDAINLLEIPCLMIVDLYKMHINIKNRMCNFSNSFINQKN